MGFALFQWDRAETQTELANQEKAIAEAQTNMAREAQSVAERQARLMNKGAYNAQLARVKGLWQHHPAHALRSLNETNQCPIDLCELTWGFFCRLCKRGGVTDQTSKLRDVESGQVLTTLQGHTSGVSSVAFAPDGHTLASTSFDNTIKQWDAARRQE